MAEIFGLIRDSYSLREARAWKATRMTDPYRTALAEASSDVLHLFKSGPDRCTAMTGVYVWRLRDMIDAPIFGERSSRRERPHVGHLLTMKSGRTPVTG